MTTNVVETESTTAVVTENDITSVVEVTSAGPAGPPGGALTIQDEGVDEGLLTDKINFAGSTVSVVNDTEAEIATVTVNAADPGANTNITSLGGITGGISSPDYVQFDTAAAAAGAVGRLLWNDTDGTLEFQMKGGNVTLQIGQEEVIRVTNKAGVTMTDGQAVYITGSTGNHLNVTLAQANAEATSSKTLAVVTETIANNNTGFATSSGLVRGLNTSALTEGAAIWLSPTVPGGLTTTRPTAPDHAVLIGWCVRQHASVGVIYVHIANGYELDELHNVLITAAANNQVLRYDAATGLWKNATISPTLTLTGDVSGSATFTDLGNATLTATVADNSHNHTIANVTGLQDALDSKLPAASYTAADVLTKIKTVDGTGSGLDADLLDGQDGAHYLDFTNATNKPDPTITLAGDATGSVTLTDLTSGTLNVTVVDDSHNHVIANVDGLQDALDSKLAAASYTATDVLDKIKTVDGAGSGLDADLLDGQSSAYYTAINDRLGYTAENAANKGVAGGYASLDGAGLVPSTQLPSYVDDVLEFANLAAFPVTGESGKIYVAVDTSKTYRWSGSTYVEISASPGSTDAVPEGSTNLYFTTARARQSISATGSLSYDNVTGVMSFTDAVTSVAGRTGDITLSTSDVSEGTNLYFTTARARSAISASGSLAYDSATGVVSYTTPNTDGIAEGTTNLYHTTARARGAVSAGTGISYNSSTGVITNAAPDQTVAITGSGTTTVTGTYPNFTVSSADQYVGTVTSVSGTGTVNGLTLTGTVTSSGSLTLGGTLSVDLSTATVTGTLPVTKGGTGVATLGANYLVKGNGTSAVGASVVYDDGTNVGIGTGGTGTLNGLTLPNNGIISFQDAGGFARNSLQFLSGELRHGGAGAGMVTQTFYTAATERARITSGGDVGIGTSTPASKLDVNGQITVPDQLAYDYTTSVLPDVAPALNLNFVQSKVVDPRITFTRSSTATFVGSNGLIQTAAVNTPRFDYDPVTRAPKGLLIEEQRTNLLTYSEQFSDAAWTKTNSSISADAIAAPDGNTVADKIVENTATGVHDVRRSVTASALTTYTQSIFVKASGRTRGQMQMFGNSGGSTINYDLTAGTATAAGAYGGWTGASATITNYGNGWYRVTNTATTNAGLTALFAAFLLADASGSASYTGDGTSGVFIWGAQLEAGSFATSYIPTVASQVTRTADVATVTGTNFSSWYNQNAGTMVCEFAPEGLTTGGAVSNVWAVNASATPSTNFTRLREGTVISGADAEMFAGGASQVDTSSFALAANVAAKSAFAWATNSGMLAANGALIGAEDTSVTPPTVNQLVLTGGNKWLRQIAFYNSRLPNAQLQALTA